MAQPGVGGGGTLLRRCRLLKWDMPKFTPVDWRTLECVFLKTGFRFARQEGTSYVKEGIARPVVIPTYREVPIFIIRTNLKTAGLSREDYFRWLQECR